VIVSVPAVLKVVVKVAVPEVSVPVPSEVVPFSNVTVPVAADGETVAVNVTLAPTAGVSVDTVSVTVLAVVPVDVGACQKSPQPASRGAAANASRIRVFPLPTGLYFTLRTFRYAKGRGMDHPAPTSKCSHF
jgi:hypothetical protein